MKASPFGAASRAFREVSELERLFDAVVAQGAELGDPDLATATLALEALSWQPELSPAEAQAGFLGLLALGIAERRGSTRVRWEGEAGQAKLSALLGPALAEVFEPAELERSVGAIQALIAGGRLSELVGDERPFVRSGPFLATQRLARSEARLGAALRARLEATPTPVVEREAAREVVRGLRRRPALSRGESVRLSREQELAVGRALLGGVTVVSGGPGTGKTSVVVAILRAFALVGVGPERVALAAPTGKAAQRIQGSVHAGLSTVSSRVAEEQDLLTRLPEAQTLHRLLGINRWRSLPRHHAGNPLEHDVLIVDEASMVSLPLMDRLLAALRPSARLILLGDADQLPAVGAGSVLSDLLIALGVAPADASPRPLPGPLVRLTTSHRVDEAQAGGASVLAVARALNEGRIAAPPSADEAAPGPDVAATASAGEEAPEAQGVDGNASVPELTRRESAESLCFDGVEALFDEDERSLRAFLQRWAAEFVLPLAAASRGAVALDPEAGGMRLRPSPALAQLMAQVERARLLTLTRVGPRGSDAVNELLHRQALATRASSRGVCAGEPLLMLQNDYELGLVNGELGLALWVETPEGLRLRAVFHDGERARALPLALLEGRVALSYATTVHKAQGSEHDHVALILPNRDLPLLCRELLYTALTRARRSVCLVGSQALWRVGAARRLERESGLVDALAP